MESITSFFTINNITIKGRMIEYAIVLKDGDTILDEREIEYGELLGDLPTYDKPGYYFENWTDANGNIVTEEVTEQEWNKHVDFNVGADTRIGLRAEWVLKSKEEIAALLPLSKRRFRARMNCI